MLVHALADSVSRARETWACEKLAGRSPKYREAWSSAALIPGWMREVNAAAMFVAIEAIRPERIVEIGSYLGRSTVFFAKSMEVLGIDGEVVAIDPHTGDRQHLEKLGVDTLSSLGLFKEHVAAAGVADRVRPLVAPSDEANVGWSEPIDFLFVDGWHSYDAVLADGKNWMPFVTPRGQAIFDDTARYPDVAQAVSDLSDAGIAQVWGEAFEQTWAGRAGTPVPEYARFVMDTSPTPLRQTRLGRITTPVRSWARRD